MERYCEEGPGSLEDQGGMGHRLVETERSLQDRETAAKGEKL